jgi:predicted permease
MEESFAEMWRERRWGGRTWAASNFSFWTQAVADTFGNALRERFPARLEEDEQQTSLPRTRNLMESWATDIRMAIRSIRRSPGVVTVAVVMLALGIGANVTIFSLTDLVALRPLPYPQAERQVFLFASYEASGGLYQPMSTPDLFDIRERSRSLNVAARSDSSFTLTGGDYPERIEGDRVTSNFFEVLGVDVALGRSFVREEEELGGAEVAVITDGLWRRAFAADPDILGRTIMLSSEPHTIIGVLPRGFWFINNLNEVYVPLEAPEAGEGRGDRYQEGVGRVRPGFTIRQANAELEEIAAGLAEEYPETNQGISAGAHPFADRIFPQQLRTGGMIALVAVALVLLIACANVANLMLARISVRGHEIAIRSALGAGRGRIVRQLLVEAMSISVLGGAFGVVLAIYGAVALESLLPDSFPRVDQIAINGRALAFALALTIFTGLLFGILPSLQSARLGIAGRLQRSRRGAVGSSGGRLRRVLVVGEVALALIVLLPSTLLIQGFFNLQAIDFGFQVDNILTLRLSLPEEDYPEDADVARFWEELVPRLAAVPGVELTGGSWFLPFMADPVDNYEIPGESYADSQERPHASVRMVFPDHFRAMGIPLIRGRLFNASDRLDRPCALIVNEAFVDRHWPGDNPVGNEVIFGGDACELVGVVGNTVEGSREHRPMAYFSGFQVASQSMYLALRTAGPPASVVTDVRTAVAGLDPELAIYRVRSMRQVVQRALSGLTIVAKVMPAVAALALSLALIGVYALMAYSVTRRTHEVGVRMALGARSKDVLRLVIRQGTSLAVVGILIGLVLAPLLTSNLADFLFDVSPFDWRAFTLVPIALLIAALAATYLPARRATRVDPLVALRSE